MTWLELYQELGKLNYAQEDELVTIKINGEYYGKNIKFKQTIETDVLDKGCYYIDLDEGYEDI